MVCQTAHRSKKPDLSNLLHIMQLSAEKSPQMNAVEESTKEME